MKVFNGSSWLKGIQVTADRSTNWNGSWNTLGLLPKFDYSNSASSTDWSNTFKAVGNAAINLVNSVPELANLGLYNAEMIHKHGISEYSSKLKELSVTEIASAYSYIAETPLQEIGGNVISGLHTPQFAEGLYTLSFSVILARPSTSGAALARPKPVTTPVVIVDDVAGGVGGSLVTKYPAIPEIAGTTERIYLRPGDLIDRYGPLEGSWFSTPNTPYNARSIPPNVTPYRQFKVLKPFEVVKSLASPGALSGQYGFGLQFQAAVGADVLIKRGIIVPYKP